MAVKLSQSLKQTQNLMMTPQLQQAIKLLTLTHLEMTNVIAEEMMENPLLEEKENSSETDVDYKVEKLEMQNQEATSENFNESTVVEKDDFDWSSYIETYNSSSSSAPKDLSIPNGDEAPNYENMISKGMSLADHLEWQLRMENLTESEWEVAELIINNIRDDGYLDIDFEEILQQTGHDREDALEILKMIQCLDPVGCAARDLKECLLVQAKLLEQRSPLLEKIIEFHLDELSSKDHKPLASKLGVSLEAIESALFILQSLTPKPGRLVASEETHYIVPDIFVVQVGGEFVVKINDEGVPSLKVSKLYQEMLLKSEENGDQKTKEFVQDKLRSALWLIKSIQNRQNTIYKVAKSIVIQQQEFFKKGPSFLKPMILRDVANEIGMHESTVSRVTTNKYMHTPIGLFELKYFFNSGIGGKNGGVDISGEVLKIKLKALVDNENPKKPLSDQKIVQLLKQEEIIVARRTVTKYREILGIESSSKRKIK